MHAPTPFCARIESRRGDTLGDFMSNIRVWLDRNRIDLAGLDPVPLTRGILAFDAYFRNEEHAVLCRQEFSRQRSSRLPNSVPMS